MRNKSLFACAVASVALATPLCAIAQETGTAVSADSISQDGTNQRQVFTPADFVQFAPNNVVDMLRRIPGFDIRGGNNGDRGLGQADFNVLVNGQRLTGKSDSPLDQLSRIAAADVVRIEILDGASLDIPGLSGQVANVTVEIQGLSGQFSWRSEYRPETDIFYGKRVEASVTGASGNLTYSVSARNGGFRGGSDGFIDVVDGDGNPIERQAVRSRSGSDNPNFGATLAWTDASGLSANINGSYGWGNGRNTNFEDASGVQFDRRTQDNLSTTDRYNYEIGGDIAFDTLGGRLKLIGLERFSNSDFLQTVVNTRSDLASDSGGQFASLSDNGERIGRGEFSWSGGGADWQVSAEAAFNRFDRVAALFDLQADGTFQEAPFPDNTSGVTEDRYEGSVSYGRPLATNLSLQLIAAAEFSRLEQSGSTANSREFWRPKGSAALGWQPASDIDVSLKIARTVGQLSFGDFLARVFLDDNNANAGNVDLVPPQTWESELEVRKTLGAWGSASVRLFEQRIEDLVEIVPVPGGQSPGNIPSATSRGIDLDATLELSQIGWDGARLDMSVELEDTALVDPLTGETRAFSGRQYRELFLNLRHDIPQTDWAYGGTLFHFQNGLQYRLTEVAFNNEGPVFAELFVENKDVFGMTAQLSASNLLGADGEYRRTVYDGFRDASPILFAESGDLKFGRIIRFSLEGSF